MYLHENREKFFIFDNTRYKDTIAFLQKIIDLGVFGLGKSFSVNSCTKSRFFHFLLG